VTSIIPAHVWQEILRATNHKFFQHGVLGKF
jgi:hypothetical protein